jgi:DNA polymerase I-like protein with 3'-5' exonuclease and polymerase domains
VTRVALDTETKGLEYFEPDQQAFLTTWSDERGNDHLAHQDDKRGMAAFVSDMRKASTLVAHNLGFDVHQLRATSGIDLLTFGKRLVDTANLARVVLPERRSKQDDDAEAHEYGYDLDALSETFLPDDQQKLDIKELAKKHGIKLKENGGYHALWQAEPEAFEDYARMDTRAAIELVPHLGEHLTDKLCPTWELERELQPHLIRAEARGVAVDQERVAPLKARYLAQRDEAYAKLTTLLGDDVIAAPDDPDATDNHEALAEALIAVGVPLYKTTKSGDQLATNKFALQEFAAEHPVIQVLSDYRQASKFLATYIGPMDGRDEVHPSFWQIGAWTGRMSCSRPNMQNLPVRGEGSSELRAMFVPRPGHVFVVSDYDQIELRLLAYYLNSDEFKAKIARGDDVFSELAAYLAPTLGYGEEFGTDPAAYRKGEPGQAKRVDAKNTTYAITYGAGGGRISDMLGLPTGPPLTAGAWTVQRGYQKEGDPSHAAARKVIAQVKSWLPGYEALAGRRGRTYRKIETEGFVSTINGRKQVVGKDKAYVGLNALIQGSAADIFKQGIINTAEATAHLGALPVLFVHDEIITECPAEHAEECLRLQDAAMEAAWDLDPALSVSGTIAHHNYSEAK